MELRSIERHESWMPWDLSCEAPSLQEAKNWWRNVERGSPRVGAARARGRQHRRRWFRVKRFAVTAGGRDSSAIGVLAQEGFGETRNSSCGSAAPIGELSGVTR